jgi:DNA-directed RNA polymerase subunit RPC12/RpoP
MGTSNFWQNDGDIPLIANAGMDDDEVQASKCPSCNTLISKWKWEDESDNGVMTCPDCGEKIPVEELEKNSETDYDEMNFLNSDLFQEDERALAELLDKHGVRQEIFKVILKDGYYSGWQIRVIQEIEDPEEYNYQYGDIDKNDEAFDMDTSEDVPYDAFEQACKKQFDEAYNKERDGILAIEKYLVENHGWTALNVSARFSNGETWYSKNDNAFKESSQKGEKRIREGMRNKDESGVRKIKISYSTVTPESAENGDFADTGWEDEEGVPFPESDYESHEEMIDDIVRWLHNRVTYFSSSMFDPNGWYSSEDEDYTSDESTEYAYHLYNFTEEEEKEIYQRLKAKGLLC